MSVHVARTRRIDVLLAEYGESHQNPTNKTIHWIAVPVIAWSVIAILWVLPIPALFRATPDLNWASIACALAVTGAKRLAELPDVPSMAEAGFPDVNIGLWSGLFAPAATPQAVTQKLETELRRAIHSPDVGDRLRALGVEPSGIASDELRRLIEADIKLTADVVKAANLTFEE